MCIASLSIILSRDWTTKSLIRLRVRAGWSAPLLLKCNYLRIPRDATITHISMIACFNTLVYLWHAQRLACRIRGTMYAQRKISQKEKKGTRLDKCRLDEPVQPPKWCSVNSITHRLRVCAGWSESLLVAQITLLEISCCCLFQRRDDSRVSWRYVVT